MGAAQGKNWALGAAALVAASSLTRLPHYSANTISNRDYTLGCFLSRPPRRAVRKSRPAARRCSAAGISHVRSQVHRRSGCCRAALLNNHPPPTLSQRRTHSACGVCVCVRACDTWLRSPADDDSPVRSAQQMRKKEPTRFDTSRRSSSPSTADTQLLVLLLQCLKNNAAAAAADSASTAATMPLGWHRVGWCAPPW